MVVVWSGLVGVGGTIECKQSPILNLEARSQLSGSGSGSG